MFTSEDQAIGGNDLDHVNDASAQHGHGLILLTGNTSLHVCAWAYNSLYDHATIADLESFL